MEVSLEGMKNQAYLFLSEIEKRRLVKKKKQIVLSKGRKKYIDSICREMKKLESSVNYEGTRKEGEKTGRGREVAVVNNWQDNFLECEEN